MSLFLTNYHSFTHSNLKKLIFLGNSTAFCVHFFENTHIIFSQITAQKSWHIFRQSSSEIGYLFLEILPCIGAIFLNYGLLKFIVQ